MKLKRVISKLLIMVLIMNIFLVVGVNAQEIGNKYELKDTITLDKLSNLPTINTRKATDSEIWKTLKYDDTVIYVLESKSGELEYAYNDNDIVYYKKYRNNKLIEEKVYDDKYFKTKEYKILPETEAIIDDIFKEKQFSDAEELRKCFSEVGLTDITVTESKGSLIIDPFANKSFRASNDVNIGLDGLTDSFPTMNKKTVAYKTFDAKPSPTVNTYIYCKDTRNAYVKTKGLNKRLTAGLPVVAAAAKVFLAPKSLLSILGLASSVTKLLTTVNFSRAIEAKSHVLRQAFMYDRTTYKRQVSVYTRSKTDYFVMGKASDIEPYAWVCKEESLFTMISPTEVLDEGIRIWQYNMDEFGRWKWGDI